LNQTHDIVDGAIIELLVGLITATAYGINFLFGLGKWKVYFITVGNHLTAFIITGIIITAMS
jgi:hypothetical protein